MKIDFNQMQKMPSKKMKLDAALHHKILNTSYKVLVLPALLKSS